MTVGEEPLLAHKADVPSRLLFVRFRGQSGQHLLVLSPSAYDPDVWSGRALQENFHRVGGCAVLHQCIRPLIGAFGAPGHHGYQRACDLITGKASKGH
jgi:hypothetical protein